MRPRQRSVAHPRRRARARATHISISKSRLSSRRWSTTWCRPTSCRPRAPIYIDRALAGGWGKGERLYMQGPWKLGVPSQGYQLPLTPADLYRAGIAAANAFCVKTYGKSFAKITESQREEFLLGLQAGKVTFENGPPARVFFTTMY